MKGQLWLTSSAVDQIENFVRKCSMGYYVISYSLLCTHCIDPPKPKAAELTTPGEPMSDETEISGTS